MGYKVTHIKSITEQLVDFIVGALKALAKILSECLSILIHFIENRILSIFNSIIQFIDGLKVRFYNSLALLLPHSPITPEQISQFIEKNSLVILDVVLISIGMALLIAAFYMLGDSLGPIGILAISVILITVVLLVFKAISDFGYSYQPPDYAGFLVDYYQSFTPLGRILFDSIVTACNIAWMVGYTIANNVPRQKHYTWVILATFTEIIFMAACIAMESKDKDTAILFGYILLANVLTNMVIWNIHMLATWGEVFGGTGAIGNAAFFTGMTLLHDFLLLKVCGFIETSKRRT
jgi:hypothetical protein